jgi:S-adenosylmethionine hydrolase
VINDYSTKDSQSERSQQERELEPELTAVAITRPAFWHTPVSPTFHGRDIFAPVAARLSLGAPASDFGQTITSLIVMPLPEPYHEADGSMVGHVLHIDAFGNLITDVKIGDIPPATEGITLTVLVHGRSINGLSLTYAEGDGLLAVIGSSGHLEIAFKGGNARDFLGVKIGEKVIIKQKRREQ